MERGELWTISGGPGFAGKPRPALIVQDDSFSNTQTVVVCPVTTAKDDAPYFRLPLAPDEANGLRAASRLMVDKITTLPRTRLGRRIGNLSAADLAMTDRALLVFLGLAR